MNLFRYKQRQDGFSLIEVLVVIAISVLVFVGLFAAFEYSLKLIAQSRAKMTALSLATDRIEYVRSLPYSEVGTVSGIPSGAIPQNRTVTLNGIPFDERVLIEFIDDPADGLALLDDNSVVSDYKKVKVEYTWNVYGTPQSIHLISTIVPRSIETDAGGGTVRVNIFDANVQPLSGIDVRLVNNTTTSTVDVTRATNADGVALFTGAPAAGSYEVFVSAPGYSSVQTHAATTSLPTPDDSPFALLESDVSTQNFSVDRLSDLTVGMYSGQVNDTVTESFLDETGLLATSSVVVTGGDLTLAESAGVYDTAGTALLAPIEPTPIVGWGMVEVTRTVSPVNDARIRFYTGTTTGTLISDEDLPGNLVGFANSFINISRLSPITYPRLYIGVDLSTTMTSLTPVIEEITVTYVESRTSVPGQSFTLQGSKTIGLNASSQPVYKNITATTTDASGELEFNDIEWDVYSVLLGGSNVIQEACSSHPFSLEPNTNEDLILTIGSGGLHNVRVDVRDSSGEPIVGATVNITGSLSRTGTTSWCGQTFFGSMNDAPDYSFEISAEGYTTQTINPVVISGDTVQSVLLVP